ncbi:MAG: transcriptional regulator, MarR family [Osedax symbiont Rs2]|nr:MAG: transcriptional regulator, MarR family [Osedax symbiont Rs2]
MAMSDNNKTTPLLNQQPTEQLGEVDNPEETRSLGEIGLSQFTPYLINRIMGRWSSNLQAPLRDQGLSIVKMRTLAVLSVISGLTINELSVYTVVEQSTMSRSLDILEAQALIRRVASAKDGRVRKIYISDLGREKFEFFWPSMLQEYNQLFTGISEAEQLSFLKTLHKILANTSPKDA